MSFLLERDALNGKEGRAIITVNGSQKELFGCKNVKVDYSLLKVAQRTAGDKAILKNTIYDTDVCLQYLVLASQVQPLTEVLIEKTNGQAKINVTGQLLCPYGE
jgi:hypothetical protein